MYELLSTSDRQQWLMASLRRQPLIIVLRPKESDLLGPFLQSLLCHRLDQLVDLGVRHIEIAWRVVTMRNLKAKTSSATSMALA